MTRNVYMKREYHTEALKASINFNRAGDDDVSLDLSTANNGYVKCKLSRTEVEDLRITLNAILDDWQ